MNRIFATVALALCCAVPSFAGFAINKSLCNQALVAKGVCTAGQVGNWVTPPGRSSLTQSLPNEDLVDLRDTLCPTPPPGETQNDCAERIIRERIKAWIADKVVTDACQTADPDPDVE